MSRLREFVQAVSRLIDATGGDETRILTRGEALLSQLIACDDWLPEQFASSDPARYRQNLLYCDALERFSVVSFVWGPGQATPVHDHTVWGLVGVLRGAEVCQQFAWREAGEGLCLLGEHVLRPGDVDRVSPRIGDIHKVANALVDRPSISIHLYGANIGVLQRHVYDPNTNASRRFISGYSNSVLPNIWDCQEGPAE